MYVLRDFSKSVFVLSTSDDSTSCQISSITIAQLLFLCQMRHMLVQMWEKDEWEIEEIARGHQREWRKSKRTDAKVSLTLAQLP